MNNLVRLTLRTLWLCLFTLSLPFLSACKAGSESSRLQWSQPVFAGLVDSRKLGELSGLAHSDRHPDVFWAINDGANPDAVSSGVRATEIFAITAQGKILASLHIDGVQNIDWEDITSYSKNNKHYLAIADTGDNGGVRRDLNIHIIEEPDVLVAAMNTKPFRSIRFVWADGPRDVESLFANGKTGQFYLVSKKRVPAELFSMPFNVKDGDSPRLIGTFDGIEQPDAATMNNKSDYGRYRAQITGADLSPDGKIIALLNYQQITLFAMPSKSTTTINPLSKIVLPWLPQAEGIAFSTDGKSLLIGGEQPPSPLIRYELLPKK